MSSSTLHFDSRGSPCAWSRSDFSNQSKGEILASTKRLELELMAESRKTSTKKQRRKRPGELSIEDGPSPVSSTVHVVRRAVTPTPSVEQAWGTYNIKEFKSKYLLSLRSPGKVASLRQGSRRSSKSPTERSGELQRLYRSSVCTPGKEDRFRDFYFEQKLKNSPGPVYVLPSSFDSKVGPTFGKPPKSRERLQGFNRYLGPRQARIEHQGRTSPGPTTKMPTTFGDSPTTRFSSTPSPTRKSMRAAQNAVSAVVRMQSLVRSMRSMAGRPASVMGVRNELNRVRRGPDEISDVDSSLSVKGPKSEPEHSVEVVQF